jgi:vancomycin resistance protein YoaR
LGGYFKSEEFRARKRGEPSERFHLDTMSSFPFVRVVCLAGAFGLAALGGVALRARYAPEGKLPGLKVDGIPLLPGEPVREFVSKRAEALLGRSVRLTVDGDDVGEKASLRELGVTVDVEAIVARVTRLQEGGDVLERAALARTAERGEIDVPLDPFVDAAVLFPIVVRLKEATDIAPISARLDLDKHAPIPERLGRYLDPDGALEAVRTAAFLPEVDTVELPTLSFPPRVSRAYVEKLDVKAMLGEYETYFSRAGDQARRGKNIDNAAQKIDGLVLSPGELVSFNDVVGERSEDNGFAKSWEIYKGEMVEGIGGGTCQVASTFYAALFFGGMDVIERLPHSRPSAYIPMGLDATVVYPIVDLKVRNPYDFPVVVHAKTEGSKLKMQLLGADKPAKVSFSRELVDTFPYKRKVVFDTKLRWSKKVVMKQHGLRGFKIKRTRMVVMRDGTKKKETNTDLYPSTTEIYEVPPGFDTALLPPLPVEEGDDDDRSDDAQSPATARSQATAQPVPTATSPIAPVACTGDCAQQALDIIEGPGAHPPTQAQLAPPKTLTLVR